MSDAYKCGLLRLGKKVTVLCFSRFNDFLISTLNRMDHFHEELDTHAETFRFMEKLKPDCVAQKTTTYQHLVSTCPSVRWG